MSDAPTRAATAREINDTIRYAMWSVFAADRLPADADRAALTAEVEDFLAGLTGRPLHPLAHRVTRWGGGLPQYAVGHVDRVARVRAAVAAAGGLALCGAVLDGVGIPACVGAATSAARDLADRLATAGARMPA